MAVGYYSPASDGSNWQTLTESWNGLAWSIVSSPDPGLENYLDGVSCTSATDCLAVGSDVVGGLEQTLVESWDGTAWSVVPSPNQPGDSNVFNGVSCTSSTMCAAVGTYWVGTEGYTLAETWDGTSWTIVPSSDPAGTSDGLSGVSCTGSMYCVAVGTNLDNSLSGTIVETWGGSRFSLTASPNPSDEFIGLAGVACTSPTSCVAVGNYFNGTVAATLVETWNGTSWAVTASPSPGNNDNQLLAVSCISSINCTAVGLTKNVISRDSTGTSATPAVAHAHPNQNLIETWDGTSWTVAGAADETPRTSEWLEGVACTVLTSCTAVGRYTSQSTNWTLAESALAVTSTSLPNGTVGEAYSSSLAAVGGNPPYHWKLYGSRLPKGLRLDGTTGVISGTPKVAVTVELRVVAEDETPHPGEATAVVSLTIS
jgi:hypothetical protein